MAEAPDARAPLPTSAIEERLARLDDLLGRLEQLPGSMGELALETVEALTDVYGAALGRVMDRLASLPDVAASLADDELLHHLLALHGIHPRSLNERVLQAIEEVRPQVASHGGEVELVAVSEGVVRVRLSGTCSGCASSTSTLRSLITDAVLAVAPELEGVEPVEEEPQPKTVFVPLADLRKTVPR
jgi:Fe-S cluster biogenesis protein NfuA